ncbi:hypothetical protein [Paraconexibacter algicola]|uniref:Uncharacterized protein n=1 Tax=Paraconexibacter algicola TaxID=2133960 RepID=A0A2T4UDE3_9ACTN|nr:hypothetical protein [Paraconexibacter algicola]PTL55523.1 hypothetical protein C7Y72_17900 [Paraconexibacter algicola]
MDLICPTCEAPVADTGISSAAGVGDHHGNIAFQPLKQHAECVCGEHLVRNPDSDIAEMRAWRLRDA